MSNSFYTIGHIQPTLADSVPWDLMFDIPALNSVLLLRNIPASAVCLVCVSF